LQKNWDSVEKCYRALCAGIPASRSGVIDAPILENQTGKPERLENALKYFRKANPDVEVPPIPAPKTSAVHPAGRSSQSAYRVLEAFDTPRGKFAWLEMRPQQGRMHQIRVHLAHMGCPLAVDRLYGKPISDFPPLARMPLHAAKLKIEWPVGSGTSLELVAPLPVDLYAALESLRAIK
jgi:23S rRNA-/tRNA-specific pseudouridylate synthase